MEVLDELWFDLPLHVLIELHAHDALRQLVVVGCDGGHEGPEPCALHKTERTKGVSKTIETLWKHHLMVCIIVISVYNLASVFSVA